MRAWMAVRLAGALLAAGAPVWAQDSGPAKKLIEVGWDLPNAERLRAHLAVMDTTPLQGCGVRFAGPGHKPALWFSFSREPYAKQVVHRSSATSRPYSPGGCAPCSC